MSAWRRVLRWVCGYLPVRVIERSDGAPYLSKYLVYESGPGRDSWRVHVHCFHQSDEDWALHNHPWEWAVGWILAGGYREWRRYERPSGARAPVYEVGTRAYAPGSVNLILSSTFHRVELLDGECWTLFVSGPIVGTWGFWSRNDDSFTPWRDFLRAKGLTPQEPWLAKRTG